MSQGRYLAFTFCLVMMVGLFNPADVWSQKTPLKISDLQHQAAEDWLKLADSGGYDASWSEASSEVKGRANKAQWLSAVNAMRSPLGERLTRGLDARKEVGSLPGWPKGEYVVLTFSSTFTHQAHATEQLILKKEADGTWRMADYSVH